MTDISAYDASVPTEGDTAAPHEWLLDKFMPAAGGTGGEFVNCADIDNLNPVPTALLTNRGGYAAKGKRAEAKKGDDWVVSFDAEKVRKGGDGADRFEIAQPWLIALIEAADATQAANRVRIRWYDALNGGEAHEGVFRVEKSRRTTGASATEGEWYSFTLTSYGEVKSIPSVDIDGVTAG